MCDVKNYRYGEINVHSICDTKRGLSIRHRGTAWDTCGPCGGLAGSANLRHPGVQRKGAELAAPEEKHWSVNQPTSQELPFLAECGSRTTPSVIQTLHGPLCLFGERPQHSVLIPPLAVLRVEVVLMNIFYHGVWNQVFHAEAPSESPPHLGGAHLVPHPLPHQEDVSTVARQHVWLVHGFLGMMPSSADADESKTPGHLLHVLIQPHAWNLESVEEISSTEELQLGRETWGRRPSF